MNVLSLFDGMSCGQQALERAGIEVENYFASEIDKYAIQVTMANYPNTIQLGSVVNVDGYSLPKIDLLIGGSPCQSFSFAGKRKGMATTDEQEILTLEHYLQLKAEGYEFEGQSYLFWEFMRLLYEVKPKYFLLENVEMGEKWEGVLTQAIGVHALHINSALVSAQNRKRIYFTNIGMESAGLFGYPVSIIEKPKDKKILLKDILESEVDEKYFLSEKGVDRIMSYNDADRSIDDNDKSLCLASGYYKQGRDNQLIVHNTQRRDANRPSIQKNKNAGGSGHLSRNDGKTYCLDGGNTNAVEIKLTSKDKRLQKIVDDNVFIEGEVAHLDTYNQTIDKDKSPALKLPHNDRFIIAPTNAVEMRGIIQHIIPEIVSVRKYEVNILSLQDCLKQHKKFNNKEIANALNVPKTMVEHWFRTDTYFSIPDKDIWLKLKELLEITTNEFDECIMTFEDREGVFEKANRVYDQEGIAPTLTSTSADERILVRDSINLVELPIIFDDYNSKLRKDGKTCTLTANSGSKSERNGQKVILETNVEREVKQINTNNKSNGGTQPYQQDRIYDVNGISPALSAGKSDLMITELNENQQKKFNPNINADKANTLTLAQGRAGSSDEYMDAVSKIANITSRIRRLTPIECERLQTVKDNYTNYVSDSQRYKMLGNGWTIEVISHIFKYIL